MAVSGSEFPIRLPERVAGWANSGEDKVHTRDNLFEYIDGGAELYLSYGFSSALSRTYSREGEPDLVVDVFDMTSSKNAFGVFSQSRETIGSAFGQGSQYTKGLLLFWKDRYYVSILASPETEAARTAVFELARAIDAAIPGKGPLPGILDLLPTESIIEESVRYFHHYIWLNSHYFVADENILHIDETTDAVLATYKTREKRWYLLIVAYPGDAEARLARADFIEHYAPELDGEPAVQIEDSTWTGCQGAANVLAVVFHAPAKQVALDTVKEVQEKVSSRRSAGDETNAR
jgi:hypothetical protein